MTNAEKIRAWRDEHPTEQLSATTIRDIIGEDLWGAALQGTNLRGADLWGAALQGTSLRGADLWGADLQNANLRGADLWGAALQNANLRGADLRDAGRWGGLRLDGLPSGQVTMVPTCDGWHLRVGCWAGTIDGLEALAAGDDDWPEAEGEERERRRPGLLALTQILRAHAEYHHDKLTAVQRKWGTSNE